MIAPSVAAAHNRTRSRLDFARVVCASDTLPHRAKPPASHTSEAGSCSPCEMSGNVPSIAAIPYAVTRRKPLMRRWVPGSMRFSQAAMFTPRA